MLDGANSLNSFGLLLIQQSIAITEVLIGVYFYLANRGSSAAACLAKYCEGIVRKGGKGRCSLADEILQSVMTQRATKPPAIPVLRCHPGGVKLK